MNAAQHTVFSMLVQGVCDSRSSLHDLAGYMICILMIGAVGGLGLVWFWILRGGLEGYGSMDSQKSRKVLAEWLREP